VALLAA
jgi:hypothetical protein